MLKDHLRSPISDRLKATLTFLEQLTLAPETVDSSSVRRLQDAGLSRQAILDAVQVCVLFNVIVRLSSTLDFDIPSDEGFRQSAKILLKRGYVM